MLDSETRRRIDTARDILVGKVPDPKSQVEQITIALIYKFMDDMDMQSVEMDGKRSFFKGKYEKYSWSNIFNPRLGGIEMLALYGEAITRMSQNENLPQLFRDIFKNAFLPYRDPETLKLFLKTINDFTYDHSERLGDAFEYLLSVLGSQGDAGQFRTPRHIIDFMVRVVAPTKKDTVLDPACGTAGFLISAYKYILKSSQEAGKPLTTQEKQRLYENFTGYDISPDMVRLSLVNLYLHGFVKPQIHEYDTLTSEDHWNEYADVILANPPFMSPKGGIKPHKRFSVQSNRSEVLFVDYMAEHLTPNGRAAIIVPEGIIFQSAGAYKQLRKYLIEQNYLWAVVSLPAGVFNPYAGVKTSILFLDRALAKKTDQVLFVKVEADGFDLGAQRRPIDRNDLPAALDTLHAWQKAVLGDGPASFTPAIASALLVSISRLAESGDYNLSADRYREVARNHQQHYPMAAIGDICAFEYGKSLKAEDRVEGEYPVYGSNGVVGYHNEYLVEAPFLVVGRKGSAGEVHYSAKNGFPIDTTFYIKLESEEKIILEYLYHILKSLGLQSVNTQAGVPGLNRNDAYKIQIPLPPLEIQRQIVDEIAAHQRVIDGARQVVEGWKPNIQLELDEVLKTAEEVAWKRVPLAEVCEQITDGTHVTPKYVESGVPFLRVTDITESNDSKKYISEEEHQQLINRCKPVKGDVLYSKNGTIGVAKLVDWNWEFSIFVSLAMLKPKRDILDGKYLEFFLNSDDGYRQATAHSKSGTVTNLHLVEIKQMEIPLPPLEVQREIVARIERERAIVEGNRELVRIFEGKIRKVIERVWEGEDGR
ncbi:MAG: N-6 DNA methylase [Anaerolineales bacterium]